MFTKIFRKRNELKAVFEITIEFSRDYNDKFGDLKEGGSYYFPNNRNHEKETTYLEIKSFLIHEIEEELKPFLTKITDLQILDLRLNGSFNGSIELIFTILFNSYQFIAGLKDFYDNLRLIKNHSNRFIKQRLDSRYGPVFNVGTNIEYPSIDRHDEMFWMMHKEGFPFFPNDSFNQKRDGLFYYLLISNIVLITLLGLLIFKAVKTYFGF
jgi:hypothetical protein